MESGKKTTMLPKEWLKPHEGCFFYGFSVTKSLVGGATQ
jgi:hypothetical protein